MSKNNRSSSDTPQRIQPGSVNAAPAQGQPHAASGAASEQPMPRHDASGIGSDEPSAMTERPAADDRRGPGPRVRIPFGAAQLKLSFPSRPGFFRYLFRDDPGRVDRAKAAGYEHVLDPVTNEPITRHGGTNERGEVTTLYLMEQPQNWHDEDVALGQKPVDEMDRAIKGGSVGREHSDADANVGVQTDGHKIRIGTSQRR